MNRFLAGAALGGFLVAMLAIVITSASGNKSGTTRTVTTTTTSVTVATHPTTTAPRQVAVKLVGTGAYDPEGDGHENDDLAPLAVDGDTTTFWKTEHYNNAVLEDGRRARARRRAAPRLLSRRRRHRPARARRRRSSSGTNPDGPFHLVSPSRPLTGTTIFTLAKGAAGRYVVVWITALPQRTGEAHVTEVRAFGPRRLTTVEGRRGTGELAAQRDEQRLERERRRDVELLERTPRLAHRLGRALGADHPLDGPRPR